MKQKIANILGPTIKEFRKKKHLTQKELSKLTGIAQNTISNHENQNRALDETDIAKYAKALGVAPQDFYTALSDKEASEKKILSLDSKNRLIDDINNTLNALAIPRVTKVKQYADNQLSQQNDQYHEIVTGRETAAGDPINGNDQDGQAVTQRVNVANIPHGTDEIVTVAGHSMEPSFPKGSQIFVHWQPTIESGELAIVRVEDEGVTFKQIFIDPNEKCVTLHSLNPEYKDRKFNHNEISIIGKILK